MSGKRPMTPLAEALDRYLDRAGLRERLDRTRVIEEWPDLVGSQIAAVTTPVSVTIDGLLRVHVTTAPWAAELSLMTPRILAKINATRKGRITGIRWLPLTGTGPTT